MSATAPERPPPGGPRARARAPPWWPLARADAARGGPAPLDARAAELLVRRGLHARPRAPPEPVGDAALGRPHREHAAAVVRARVGRSRACSAPARSRCGCPPRSPGSRPCRSRGRSDASSVGSPRRRSPAPRSSPCNPLFVWYSQEARAYALFVLHAALAMLCFLRAEREPTAAADGGVRAHRRRWRC